MNYDIPSEIHAQLDAQLDANMAKMAKMVTIQALPPFILSYLLTACTAAYADIWPIDQQWTDPIQCSERLTCRSDIQALLVTARATGRYAQIRNLRV